MMVLKPLAGRTPSGTYSFTACTVENGCLPQPQKTGPVIFGPKQYWHVPFSVKINRLCISVIDTLCFAG
jgi:hypothetical protein